MKLHALQEELQLASKFDLYPLEVETCSIRVINTINNGHTVLANLIHSCRSLMHQEKVLLLRHNFRERNVVADALAKEVKNKKARQYNPRGTKVLAEPPIFVEQLLTKDMSRGKQFFKKITYLSM